jgi:hypothetical protein
MRSRDSLQVKTHMLSVCMYVCMYVCAHLITLSSAQLARSYDYYLCMCTCIALRSVEVARSYNYCYCGYNYYL